MSKKSRILTPDEENKLVKLAADGDDYAFEEIVSAYENTVYNMAMYIAKNNEDALDISQEVFLKLWQSLKNFRGESSLRTYIMKLVKNTSIDFVRKRKNRQTLSLTVTDNDGEEKEIEIKDTSPESDPVEHYMKNQRIETVRAAISRLDDDHREILIMRDMNGMEYKEISEALGISEGTVKSRLHRARNFLKNFLKEGNFF